MAYLRLTDRDRGEVILVQGRPDDDMVRWGLAHGSRTVFAARGTPPPEPGSSFSPLDSNLNVRRRVEFESALAAYVLMDTSCVMPAVNQLTERLIGYLDERKADESVGMALKGTLYNVHFGRVGLPEQAPDSGGQILREAITTMRQGSLQQILNIHQAFSYCVTAKLGFGTEELTAVAAHWGNRLRPNAFFSGSRGRAYRRADRSEGDAVPVVGYSAPTDRRVASFVEVHPRAVELFRSEAPDAEAVMRTYHGTGTASPFVAGISGSTADLMKMLKTFCPNASGEMLKQYALACVGYLTGGGHHTFEEVMRVAEMAGVDYLGGQYEAVLPETFRRSAWFDLLLEDYADILYSEYDSSLLDHTRLDG